MRPWSASTPRPSAPPKRPRWPVSSAFSSGGWRQRSWRATSASPTAAWWPPVATAEARRPPADAWGCRTRRHRACWSLRPSSSSARPRRKRSRPVGSPRSRRPRSPAPPWPVPRPKPICWPSLLASRWESSGGVGSVCGPPPKLVRPGCDASTTNVRSAPGPTTTGPGGARGSCRPDSTQSCSPTWRRFGSRSSATLATRGVVSRRRPTTPTPSWSWLVTRLPTERCPSRRAPIRSRPSNGRAALTTEGRSTPPLHHQPVDVRPVDRANVLAAHGPR
jgi:hypothetical protein